MDQSKSNSAMRSPPSSPVSVPEYNTQFSPHPDDKETLWSVREIVREDKHRYLVRWEGVDPQTGKPWDLNWVPKHDCTDGLIHEWKMTKARKAKKRRKQSSVIKADTDHKSIPAKKSSVNSRDNSRSVTATRSSNKPPSAGPSGSRDGSIPSKGKLSPFVEITRSKKRQLEPESRQSGNKRGEEREPEAPKNKKRKLAPTSTDAAAHSTNRPAPRKNRDTSDLSTDESSEAPVQLPRTSPLRSSTTGKDDAGKETDEVSTSTKQKHRKPPPHRHSSHDRPSLESSEVGPIRKVGKRRVVVSSQESGAVDGRIRKSHLTISHPQDQDISSYDDEPVERTSSGIDVNNHHVPDLDIEPYDYDDPQMGDFNDGVGGIFDGVDDVPQKVESKLPIPASPHTPSSPPASRSISPPSPHALLRSLRTGSIVPETQLTPSSKSHPQPLPLSAKGAPAKPASAPLHKGKTVSTLSFPDSPPNQNGPGSKPKSTADAALPLPSPGRDVNAISSGKTTATRFPMISPAKPNPARELHPVPTMLPSMFRPYMTLTPQPASQLSSIDTFTPQGKGKGRKGKRPAYSQREEEEEPSESGSGSGSVDGNATGPENKVEEEEEDEIDDDHSVIGDEATRQRRVQRFRVEKTRKGVDEKRDPGYVRKPLSKVLSDHGRKRSPSVGTSSVSDVEHADFQVQPGASHEVTSSSSVDSIHRGVIKPSVLNRVVQWWSGSSSGAGDVQEEGDWVAITEAPGMDQDGDTLPDVELSPDDAPDAREQGPISVPILDSGSIPPNSGEVNYSFEATGPWTPNSQPQPPLPRVIKSPTKQLDSALGLLNRKSEEIQELREAVEVAHGRTAGLEREMKALQVRLVAAERRYGEVSAALDMEMVKTQAERESTTHVVGVVENIRFLEDNARLLQDNERLKVTKAQLESDTDMLRGLYAHASDAHQATLAENHVLERENRSLKVQATTGVKQAGTFWQAQVRTLETELTRARGAVKVLTDQAQRTGDDLRKRAALLPMVQREVDMARAEVEEWMEKVRELGRENTRLRVEVKDWEDEAMARRKREQGAERREEDEEGEEVVWMCPWMDAQHKSKCAALLDSREKLREHLYEAGHI